MKRKLISVLLFIFITFISEKAYAKILNFPDEYLSIKDAINATEYGDSVLIAPGAYYESQINLKSGVTILGADRDTTIIDGRGTAVFYDRTGSNTAIVENLTIRSGMGAAAMFISTPNSSPNIINNVFTDSAGGVVFYVNEFGINTSNILNNKFINNDFGIYIGGYPTVNYSNITNNIFTGNDTGIYLTGDSNIEPLIQNNTIDNNGDGIEIGNGPQPKISNNIITNNNGAGILLSGSVYTYIPEKTEEILNSIQYNDVFNNQGGNYVDTRLRDQTGIHGNISQDPLYVNVANGDYRLQSDSPSIDTGDPSILDPDGSRSDMGAYGGPNAKVPQGDGIEKRYAVVIGDDDYGFAIGPWNKSLNFPSLDAHRTYAVLTSDAYGFDSNSILLLDKNWNSSDDLSKAKVQEAIQSLKEKTDVDDTILFYFAGHGAQNEIFLHSPGEGTGLTPQELMQMFNGVKAKSNIFVFASCQSESMTNSMTNAGAGGNIAGTDLNADNFQIITASKSTESGYKLPSEAGITGSRFGSFFVDALTNGMLIDKFSPWFINKYGLTPLVDNGDGILTIDEMFNYTSTNTQYSYVNPADEQHPQMYLGKNIPASSPITDIDDDFNKFNELLAVIHSPGYLEIVDPYGRVLNRDMNSIGNNALFFELFEGEDINVGDWLGFGEIFMPLSGNYQFRITPKPGIDPLETFSLELFSKNQHFFLAENQPIGYDTHLFQFNTESNVVPEPSTIYLLGIGIILGLRKRFRRRPFFSNKQVTKAY